MKSVKVYFGAVVLGGLMAVSSMVLADGAVVFNKCKACHGADGKGNAAMKAPAFDAAKSEADLVKIIEAGRGKMPSYKGKLTDAEIAEVAKHIKGLK